MKKMVCPYCGKTIIDDDFSFRFRCQHCKEWLIDLDKNHCRPERYWEGKNKNEKSKSN